jgi:hypothetical protein
MNFGTNRAFSRAPAWLIQRWPRERAMTDKQKSKGGQTFTDEAKKADAARTPEQNHAVEVEEQKAAASKAERVDRVHGLAR